MSSKEAKRLLLISLPLIIGAHLKRIPRDWINISRKEESHSMMIQFFLICLIWTASTVVSYKVGFQSLLFLMFGWNGLLLSSDLLWVWIRILGRWTSLPKALLHIYRVSLEILIRITETSQSLDLSVTNVSNKPWRIKAICMQYGLTPF